MDDTISKSPTPEIDALADRYDVAVRAGQAALSRRWRSLGERTKELLTSAGYYTGSGERKPVELENRNERADSIESLEYNLGVIARCAASTLPDRPLKGVALPPETNSEQVLTACSELLYLRQWRDAQFFRMALQAVAMSKFADALWRLPVKESDWYVATKGIGSVGLLAIYGLLFIGSPLLAANTMVAAATGDSVGATVGMYGLGVVYLLSKFKQRLKGGQPTTPSEKAHEAWAGILYRHYQTGGWLSTGVGAAVYLKGMMDSGVEVPPIAFDLCAALQEATLGSRSSVLE
jgi:hypothetical protein